MLLLGFGLAVAAAGLAMLAAWALNRHRGGPPEPANQAVIESLKVISTLFVISFAFVMVNALADIAKARQTTFAEAYALRQVYWAGDAMAPADRDNVQAAVRKYATDVAQREWAVMKRGDLDETTWEGLDLLREYVGSVPASTDTQRAGREEALGALRKVYEARGERVAHVAEGLPDVMVWAMVINGVVMLAFMILIGFRQTPMQLGMLGIVAALLTAGIFLVIELNHPFGDGISVSPQAYVDLLRKISG